MESDLEVFFVAEREISSVSCLLQREKFLLFVIFVYLSEYFKILSHR
jgi:hypothetical protein